MNYSKVITTAYGYLKLDGKKIPKSYTAIIQECIDEIELENSFKHLYAEYTHLIDCINKEPYKSFLKGSSRYILSVSTLGIAIDKKINYYTQTDLSKAVIFDAVASAYLEEKATEIETQIIDNPTMRFCPGYSGSSTKDIKEILNIVNANKSGIYLANEGLMIPQKTMVGIIGNNGNKRG